MFACILAATHQMASKPSQDCLAMHLHDAAAGKPPPPCRDEQTALLGILCCGT